MNKPCSNKLVDNSPRSGLSISKMAITRGQACPSNHSIWYLLFSNLHPCLQDSDIGWNCIQKHLHRLATNIVLFVFWTNTLNQGGQELPSNFFIFKSASFSQRFLLNCLYFSKNICSMTSSIGSHFFFPYNKPRYFSTCSRMLLFNEMSVLILVNNSPVLVLFSDSVKALFWRCIVIPCKGMKSWYIA